MSFDSPMTVPPGQVAIKFYDRADGGERVVSIECCHADVHLGCSKPDVVSVQEHVRDALGVHVHEAGCRCSESCWSDWHPGMPWPWMRNPSCTPEVN